MAYFIFIKNSDNVDGALYRIAENQSDLNNFNFSSSDYKIIEDSQSNFEAVKYGTKAVQKYDGNTITYLNTEIKFSSKKALAEYILSTKTAVSEFLNSNKNHPQFNLWNSYFNQLNSLYSQLNLLDFTGIDMPMNKSLEQYFKDLNQISLNPLQIP